MGNVALDSIMDDTANSNNKTRNTTNNNSSLEGFLKLCSIFLIIITFPISLFFCFKIVKEYERAVIFRLGRLKDGHGVVGPGLFFIIPCMDEIRVVDLRTISFDVPAQEVLTKDHVTVLVDAVVYYSVFDAMLAVCEVEMAGVSTRLLAATTLRNMMGTKTLEEILSQKEETAKIVAAEGEKNAAVALKEASDTISDGGCALQLPLELLPLELLPLELLGKGFLRDKEEK